MRAFIARLHHLSLLIGHPLHYPTPLLRIYPGSPSKGFGIKVTIVEPGAYATDFGISAKVSDVLEPYASFSNQFVERLCTEDRGEPNATAEAMLKLVDVDNPPLRLVLGSQVLPRARALYADRIATWEAWKDVSDAAQGEPTKMTLGS